MPLPPLLPRSANSLIVFLSLLPIIFPSPSAAAAPCNDTQINLIAEAFQSVTGLNRSLLHSPAFVNCTDDGAIELRLPRRNLSGTVSWVGLANHTGLRVLNLSGNALFGAIPTEFFALASSLLHLDLASNDFGGPIRINGSSSVSYPLLTLDLSGNRFTNRPSLSGLSSLQMLDLSGNNISAIPEGIEGMKSLEHLDLSWCNISQVEPSWAFSGLVELSHLDLSGNGMSGSFPRDLPPLSKLKFLNLSRNNFSGVASPEQVKKFGRSAFMSSGVRTAGGTGTDAPHAEPLKEGGEAPYPEPGLSPRNNGAGPGKHHQGVLSQTQQTGKATLKEKKKKTRRPAWILGIAIGCALVLLAVAAVASAACCLYRRRKRERKRKQWTITIPGTWKAAQRGGGRHYKSSTPRSPLDPEAAWVAEASVSAPSAPLVMFEKPLMELTFSDMVAATSGFGRESQLAEGRATGPVYRAVLPVDMDVAIKLLVCARGMEESQAKAAVQELAGLKHPNLLPLVGYCIAGREKLLLYQYMENGDLHRWLHELPLSAPAPSLSCRMMVDDWAAGPTDTAAGLQARSPGTTTWASRYRIALGVARGLAFLHHAASGTPIVHGSVEASNVLLDESLEPRVAGLWPRITPTGGDQRSPSVADDVYGYGAVLLELLTGRVGSRDEVGRIRGMFKGGNGPAALDPHVLDGSEEAEEKEMVEALRVAYLCTADPAEKRPTMRQVVGLLKDIRPLAV